MNADSNARMACAALAAAERALQSAWNKVTVQGAKSQDQHDALEQDVTAAFRALAAFRIRCETAGLSRGGSGGALACRVGSAVENVLQAVGAAFDAAAGLAG